MKTLFHFFAFVLLFTIAPAQEPTPLNSGKSYPERSEIFIRYLAAAKPSNPNFPKEAMPYYAARLQLGVDPEGTRRVIDTMLDATVKAKTDPFNLHAVVHAYFLKKDAFTPEMRRKIWKLAANWNYSKPTGVSLNYDLMRDGAGYLAAQEWPDLKDLSGNDGKKILALCKDRLMRQYTETCNRNASEYDAPIYYGTDFAPARMVAEFSQNPQLAKAAKMTLDFMLIHTGAHWHHGYHISTAGRGKYWGSLNLGPHSSSPTNGMAFLLYGSDQPYNLASAPQTYWLAHPGKALDPGFLATWQASLPDTRTVLANHLWPTHGEVVRKIAWFTKGYGLASQREDESPFTAFLFKECRRTMLKWESPKRASSFTIIQENRRRPNEKIRNNFAYGENPYCQTMQHEGTLIGVYDVPEDYGFWITRAPFTTSGAIVSKKEQDGWVLCHGGSMLFAFRFTEASKWDKPDTREQLELLRCDAKRGAWILETSPLAPFAGGGPEAELKKFADALTSRTKIISKADQSPPRITFKNLKGHTLDLTWKPLVDKLNGQCQLNGEPLDYTAFPLLQTTNTLQPTAGPITLTVGGKTRTWDFKSWTITDR